MIVDLSMASGNPDGGIPKPMILSVTTDVLVDFGDGHTQVYQLVAALGISHAWAGRSSYTMTTEVDGVQTTSQTFFVR